MGGAISDERMDQIIQRAKDAATRGVGGGDGTPYREIFSDEVYKATLTALIELEIGMGRSTGASETKSG